MPTSEMLPHMQDNALLLLLLTCVFPGLLALGNATDCSHPSGSKDGKSAVEAGQTFAFQ